MKAYLVRHAKAEERADGGGGDAQRRLTPEGGDRFRALAAALAARARVRRILASPYRRARETAEILAAALGAPVELEAALASGTSTGGELLELLAEAGDGAALVGHNPELADAIAQAAGHELEVKPGTVAEVERDGKGWRLCWLERPGKP